jgi:hypothetical protein
LSIQQNQIQIMSIVQNLLGGFAPNDNSNLGTGGDPRRIWDGNANAITKHYSLPPKVTANQLVETHQQLGQVKAQNELLKEYSSNTQKIVDTAIANHQIRTAHSQHMMGAEVKFREINSAHSQNVGNFQLNAATTQAYHDGYTQELKLAGDIIDIS